MAKVFFASARAKKWKYDDSMPGKFERLLKAVDFSSLFNKNEWVAVKTHFGSYGAHRIVRPIFLRKVTEALKAVGAMPCVTDSVRIMGLEYLEVANQNGINPLSCGAPVVIADGLYGKDNIAVKTDGDLLEEAAVPSLIHDVPAMVVCSHVKGHINAGYAGAIKNVAMGCVSSEHRHCGWKKGRGAMHAIGEGLITWDSEKCVACNQCVEVCPLDSISFQGDQLRWNKDNCWRCGRCERVCQSDALKLPGDDFRFMSVMCEAVKAVLSTFATKKVFYINFLTEIQPECDCMPIADVPIIQDIGILASDDIVAVEQASMDMLLKSVPLPASAASDAAILPHEDILTRLHNKPYLLQVQEAEKLGLGSSAYAIVEIV
jgi:hypothetical protein